MNVPMGLCGMQGSCRARRAFTLIELLAAMTILIVMVLLISQIFSGTSKTWEGAAKRIESYADGRAVIDFMSLELAGVLADSNVQCRMYSDQVETYGKQMKADNIYFLTTENRASGTTAANAKRQTKAIHYALTEMKDSEDKDIKFRYRIMRYALPDSQWNLAQQNPSDWISKTTTFLKSEGAVLAENVRTLEFWVYDRSGAPVSGSYDSLKDGPPSRIEIYIEMLGESDAIKAQLFGAYADEFCNDRVRRFVGRVYPYNVGGHL